MSGYGVRMVVFGVMMYTRASRQAKEIIGNDVAVIGKDDLGQGFDLLRMAYNTSIAVGRRRWR